MDVKKTLAAIAMFALCASSAQAEDSGTAAQTLSVGPGLRIMQLLSDLNVSTDQKHQIAKIVASNRQDLRTGQDRVFAAREKLFASIHQDTFDEAAVRSASQNVAEQEEDFAVTRAKVVSQVRSLLTDQQKEVLAKARDDFKGRLHMVRDTVRTFIDRWIARMA